MNTNINKNVICIKDIPSNLIEEAIFILKSDNVSNKNVKAESIRRDLILRETEELVNEYSNHFLKLEENEKKNKFDFNTCKFKIVLGAVLFALICYLISMIM